MSISREDDPRQRAAARAQQLFDHGALDDLENGNDKYGIDQDVIPDYASPAQPQSAVGERLDALIKDAALAAESLDSAIVQIFGPVPETGNCDPNARSASIQSRLDELNVLIQVIAIRAQRIAAAL